MAAVVARITARVWRNERYTRSSVLDGLLAVRKHARGLLTAEPHKLECGAWYIEVKAVATPQNPMPRRVAILYTDHDTACWCAGWECAQLADLRAMAATLGAAEASGSAAR